MAATPKPIRRELKNAKKFASGYLGVRINPQVVKGCENKASTRFERGKVRSTVHLKSSLFAKNANRKSKSSIGKAAQHEFFHSGLDSYGLRNAGKWSGMFSEAFAMVSSADFELSRSRKAYKEYVSNLKIKLQFNPLGFDETHYYGAHIAINIFDKFPTANERKKHIRETMRHNAQILSKANKSSKFKINSIGKVSLVK